MADNTPTSPGDSGSKKQPEQAKPTRAVSIPTPIPDDSSSIFPQPGSDDDAVVDFGHMPTNPDGSASLSHSQISGPLSGTSVVSWTELMKARADEEAKLQYDSLENIDLDTASDQDLLEKALASEPPSGKLNIPQDDRPHGSLSKEFIDLDDEIARKQSKTRRRTEDETILPNFPIDEQTSSILDDGRGDSSKINLLSDQESPIDVEIVDDDAEVGAAVTPSGESSAIDLGSQSVVDLPYPIEGSSSTSGTKSKSGRSSKRHRADSGRVDLVAGNGDDLANAQGLTAVGSGLRRGTGDPSTKRVDVARASSSGWVGGGLIGGLTGVAICAGIWFSGALDRPAAQQSTQQLPPQLPQPSASDTTIAAVRDVLSQAKLDTADPAAALTKLLEDRSASDLAKKKAEAEKQAADDERKAMRDQVKDLNAQLTATQQNAKTFENLQKTAEDNLKNAMSQLADAQASQKKADDERKQIENDLKAVQARLAAIKPTAPPTDNSELNRLKDEREKLEAKAKELESQLVVLTRASENLQRTVRDLGTFVASVRQKLQVPPDANPSEVLTALDSTLAAKPLPELGPLLPGTMTSDPRADRAFHRGISQYRAGNFIDAENEFLSATKLQNRDARFWYYLGLTQFALGQAVKSQESLKQGLDREQRNLPRPDTIDAMLERMSANERAIINRARGRN